MVYAHELEQAFMQARALYGASDPHTREALEHIVAITPTNHRFYQSAKQYLRMLGVGTLPPAHI